MATFHCTSAPSNNKPRAPHPLLLLLFFLLGYFVRDIIVASRRLYEQHRAGIIARTVFAIHEQRGRA